MPGLPLARLWGGTAPPGTAGAFLVGASALLFGASPSSAQPIGVEHEALGCIVAGHFTRVAACFTAAAPIAAARVVFRAAGTTHWYSVGMSPSGECHAGFLPKAKKSTRSVEYYVEAIDRASAEGRTPDYAPRVEDECESRGLVAASPGSALLRVTAPPGAPPLPTGFSSEGIAAAAGSGAAAAAGGVAAGAGAAAAGSGGISTLTIGLVAGGAAAAATGIAVASKGSSSESYESQPASPPPACTEGQVRLARLAFESVSFVCPRGSGRVEFPVILLADLVNNSGAAVQVLGVQSQIRVVATAPNSVGGVSGTASFAPSSLPAQASTSVRVQLTGDCENRNTDSSFRPGYIELGGSLSLSTSCGVVTGEVQNTFRTDFP